MKIKTFMNRDFASLSPHDTLREVARIFFETGTSVLPVVEVDGTLAGVITIDDFILIFLPSYIDLIRSVDFIRDFGALERTSFSVEEKLFVAEDLMRLDAPVLDENDSVMKAAAVLHKSHFQRIPVLSGGKLVGMMSQHDVCRALYETEGSE